MQKLSFKIIFKKFKLKITLRGLGFSCEPQGAIGLKPML
jgi:hypothetical protein